VEISMPEQQDVVAVGILLRNNRVLLCHRSASSRWYPGVWDLPGGHVEANKAVGAALIRELREELAIEVVEPHNGCLLHVITGELDTQVWLITEWEGMPFNASPDEHDDIAWFPQDQAMALLVSHASYPTSIVNALKLAQSPNEA
jgi:8-oxo-dGTP pyrophosphatase MutT (NUDIX family)